MQYTSFFNTHEAIVEDAVFERVQKVDIIFNFVGGGNQFSFCHATETARRMET